MKTLNFSELNAEQKDSACESMYWIFYREHNEDVNIREMLEQDYNPNEDFIFEIDETDDSVLVIEI